MQTVLILPLSDKNKMDIPFLGCAALGGSEEPTRHEL